MHTTFSSSALTEARAGAHWRTHASDTDHEQQEWDIETYEDWTRLLERENRDPSLPRSGLKVCPPNLLPTQLTTPPDRRLALLLDNLAQNTTLVDPTPTLLPPPPPLFPTRNRSQRRLVTEQDISSRHLQVHRNQRPALPRTPTPHLQRPRRHDHPLYSAHNFFHRQQPSAPDTSPTIPYSPLAGRRSQRNRPHGRGTSAR